VRNRIRSDFEANLEPCSDNCNPDKLILMEVQDNRFKPFERMAPVYKAQCKGAAHMTEIFRQESSTFGSITFSSDSTFKCFALMSEKCKFTLQSIQSSFRNTGIELERTRYR